MMNGWTRELLTRAGFEAENLRAIEAAGARLSEDEDWRSFLETDPCGGAESGEALMERMRPMAERAHLPAESAFLCCLISGLPALAGRYLEKGWTEELLLGAARDLHSKMAECLEMEDVCGTQGHSFAFELGFFRLRLFALGRLQYEQRVYPGPDCELPGGVTVRAGDRIYGMHIPSGAPLERQACRDSYQRAFEFFGCTRERPLIVHCNSWLLNPDHRWMLPESSRIIGFMNDFKPTCALPQERFTAAWRIFGKASLLPMEQWPEDNALRRGYLRLLREGRPVQNGQGLLLYRGE